MFCGNRRMLVRLSPRTNADNNPMFMTGFPKFVAAVFLVNVTVWFGFTLVKAETLSSGAVKTPRAVVERWLELHRTGKRDDASMLTTGSRFHRADALLSPSRDEGVRVACAVDNGRAAAVVATRPDDANEGNQGLLFWLVRRDGDWVINKSDIENKQVVKERLRGFLESGDVHWDVQRHQLLGLWEADAGTAPIVVGIACGSRIHLDSDNRYQVYAWGPYPPETGFESDEVLRGSWRLDDDRIHMLHQGKVHQSRIVWLMDNLLTLESMTGEGRATYKLKQAASDGDEGNPTPQ